MGVCYSRNDTILNDIMTFISKSYTLSKKDYKVIKKLYDYAIRKTFETKDEKYPFDVFNSICRKEIDIHPTHMIMVTTKNNFHEKQEGKELLARIKKKFNQFYLENH